jgi:hypothetical protein
VYQETVALIFFVGATIHAEEVMINVEVHLDEKSGISVRQKGSD